MINRDYHCSLPSEIRSHRLPTAGSDTVHRKFGNRVHIATTVNIKGISIFSARGDPITTLNLTLDRLGDPVHNWHRGCYLRQESFLDDCKAPDYLRSESAIPDLVGSSPGPTLIDFVDCVQSQGCVSTDRKSHPPDHVLGVKAIAVFFDCSFICRIPLLSSPVRLCHANPYSRKQIPFFDFRVDP